MSTTAPTDVDLWISDDELAELAMSLERLVARTRPQRPGLRPAFYVDYVEVE